METSIPMPTLCGLLISRFKAFLGRLAWSLSLGTFFTSLRYGKPINKMAVVVIPVIFDENYGKDPNVLCIIRGREDYAAGYTSFYTEKFWEYERYLSSFSIPKASVMVGVRCIKEEDGWTLPHVSNISPLGWFYDRKTGFLVLVLELLLFGEKERFLETEEATNPKWIKLSSLMEGILEEKIRFFGVPAITLYLLANGLVQNPKMGRLYRRLEGFIKTKYRGRYTKVVPIWADPWREVRNFMYGIIYSLKYKFSKGNDIQHGNLTSFRLPFRVIQKERKN